MTGQASELEREVERERGEKVPNTRKTRAPYFCKSGFIRKARVVRRDVELPELPILYKKTFTARGGCVTHRGTHAFTLYIAHGLAYYLHTYTSTKINPRTRHIYIFTRVWGEIYARPFFRYHRGPWRERLFLRAYSALTRRRGVSP